MAQHAEDDPLVIGSHFNYRFVSSLLNNSRGSSQWLAFGGCSQYLLRVYFSGFESRGASQWVVLDYRNRPSRDKFWGILYLILMALTLIGGIYGIVNR